MGKVWLPFLCVLFPQMALAIINHGKLVLAPLYISAAGLSPETVGIIGGLSGLGSVWFFSANSVILPSFGPVRALIFGCFLAPFGAMLLFFHQPWLIFTAAVIMGFGYAITAPAGSQILAAHTPKRLWGTLFSIRMAGVPVGGALAGLAGGSIASLYGWEIALLVIALPAVATGLFLAIVKGKISDSNDRVKFRFFNLFNPLNLLSPFKVLKKVPGLPLITFVSIGYASIQGGVFTFLTTYLMTELKMPLVLVGGLYATMQVASFAGRISVGVLADRFFSPRSVLIILGLMGPFGIYILTILNNNFSPFFLFPAMALIGVSIASWNGLFMTEVTNVAQNHDVSEATSASTFFTFITYMLAPLVFGFIALSYGYKYAFYSVGACGLASVVALLIKAFKERTK
jgi:MFS family permease|tara:strand:- start:3958 stop:5160 length:1203 start_codon:yes stop_codon:yes gene_type:complete